LIYWQGTWDEGERPVINGTTINETAHEIEINLTLTGWGDDYPHDPDLIQIFKNRDVYLTDDAILDAKSPQIAQFIKIDGQLFNGNFPLNKEVNVEVDFAGLIKYLVEKDEKNKNGVGLTGRKILIPPVSGSWEGAKTTAIGVGTEARSVTSSGGPIADLYITNWREEVINQAQPSPSSSIILIKPGDIDGNGVVNIFDFNLLVTNFNKTGANLVGDIDNNGKVDIFDFNLLITNFGK
jgi:hypothetical protein